MPPVVLASPFHSLSPSRSSLPPAALPQDAPPLHEVLRRAGEYVVGYETGFALVVAEERYVQTRRVQKSGPVHETRVLRSDVVFIRSPGTALPWQLLRDVYEVDGAVVRDRQQRLETLLLGGSSDRPRARAGRSPTRARGSTSAAPYATTTSRRSC